MRFSPVPVIPAFSYNKLFPRLFLATTLFATLVLTLAFDAPAAQAHSDLLRSDPPISSITASQKLPGQLKLWFNEQPDLTFSRIQVTGPDSLVATTGNIQSDPKDPNALAVSLRSALPDGVYNVSWKVISLIDRHLTQGQFSFGVGPAGSSSQLGLVRAAGLVSARPGNDATNLSIWSVLNRWLNYLAAALLFGVTVFAVLIWFPFTQNFNREIKLEEAFVAKVGQVGWLRLSWIAGWSFSLLVAGWLAGVAYQFLTESGTSPFELLSNLASLGSFLTGTLFGLIWLFRLVLILLAGLLYVFVKQAARKGAPASFRSFFFWSLLLGDGLFILITTSLNSHAASTTSGSALLAIANDWVHLAATSCWVGGVLSLVLVLPEILRVAPAGSGNRTRLAAALLKPFSVLALGSLIILGITGLLAAFREINSLTTLFTTWYGQALLIKVVLVLFTMLLGAGVWLFIQPRLAAFARPNDSSRKSISAGSVAAGRTIFQFRQIVTIEALLLVVVLVSVGVLTSLAPPRNPAVETAQTGNQTSPDATPRHSDPQFSATVAGYQLEFVVSPAETGPNSFTLYVQDAKTGQPFSDFNSVRLEFSKPASISGKPLILELENGVGVAPGFYQASSEYITEGGLWQIKAVLHKEGSKDLTYTFELNISG